MYEKILATICTTVITFGVIWFVCRRNSDRRSGKGTGSDADPVRDGIERAGENNQRLGESIADAQGTVERIAEDTGRAGQGNKDAQELVQKARNILGSAKRTDSHS